MAINLNEYYGTAHDWGRGGSWSRSPNRTPQSYEGEEASFQKRAQRMYNQHVLAEANAGRSLNPANRDLVRFYAPGHYTPSARRAEGFGQTAFSGREDSSPTYLGNSRDGGDFGKFAGGQDFTGNNYSSGMRPSMGDPSPPPSFSPSGFGYPPPPPPPRSFGPRPYVPAPSRYSGNSMSGGLDSRSGGNRYLDSGPMGQSAPPSMQGLMALAQSVVSNSAQGMSNGGAVRTKINSGGFRKGGPMERMVSEMSNYSSGRR